MEMSMRNRPEKATEFTERRVTRAWLDALAKVRALRPPCARCMRRDATRVIDGDEPTSVCRECAESARLDARVRAQRAQREAMRARVGNN